MPQERNWLNRIEIRKQVAIPMRDGTKLAADIYLPDGGSAVPALLMRSPYGKDIGGNKVYADPVWYARKGFAVVSQDVRGRWDSEGEFYPYRHESDDGVDSIKWVVNQQWCSGRVATYGFSYSGAVQMLISPDLAEGLWATAPGMTGAEFFEGWTYRNGAFNLNLMVGWASFLGLTTAIRAHDLAAVETFNAIRASPQRHYGNLPIRETFPEQIRKYVPFFEDWLDHPRRGPYWEEFSPKRIESGGLPGLYFGGWYDAFIEGTIESYCRAVDEGDTCQQLVVGPWFHMPLTANTGSVSFGDDARNEIDDLHLRFFSRWLRDEENGIEDEAPVRVFVMGENRWCDLENWPPLASDVVYHLCSDGRANSLNGTGLLNSEPPSIEEPPDIYRDDPLVPVMSAGGRGCCVAGVDPMGPADQRAQESRNDVLVYTSDPLESPLRVIGRPRFTLFAATDAQSTDFIVRLVDVQPDGLAINVSDGNIRIPPDKLRRFDVQEFLIDLSPTAIVFDTGHRIRLDVMSSNFPLFDRNPNNGVDPSDATWADLKVATQFVFHDLRYPSRLTLPAVGR